MVFGFENSDFPSSVAKNIRWNDIYVLLKISNTCAAGQEARSLWRRNGEGITKNKINILTANKIHLCVILLLNVRMACYFGNQKSH